MADETSAPSDQAASSAPPVEDNLSIVLRKPIIASGDEVKELKFREPTGGDIEMVGNPVLIDMFTGDTPRITFDSKVMSAMMARLATVPPSAIRMMHPRDWNTAAWKLTNFFMPDL